VYVNAPVQTAGNICTSWQVTLQTAAALVGASTTTLTAYVIAVPY
jgi:hypothetical protein